MTNQLPQTNSLPSGAKPQAQPTKQNSTNANVAKGSIKELTLLVNKLVRQRKITENHGKQAIKNVKNGVEEASFWFDKFNKMA